MKARFVISIPGAIFLASAGVGWAIENPIGPVTVPPASISDGLVTSPTRVDIPGNLVVTGNVGGGKHFRGFVPYDAVWDFRGTLGSSRFDSFLRRSVPPVDFSQNSLGLTPFYSQTRTVTTSILPAGVSGPLSPRVGGRVGGDTALSSVSARQSLLLQGLLSPEEFRLRSGYGLVSITPQETRILMGVASDRSLSEGLELAEALRRSRAERVPKDLFRGEVPGDVSELSKDTLVVDDSDVRYESSQFLPELKQPTGELELPRGLPEVQYRFERGREQKEAAEPDLLGELSEEVESGLLGRGEGTGMDVSKPLGRISVGAGGMRAPSELRSTTGRSDRVLAPGIREGEFMPAGARRTTLRGRGEREELPDVRRGTLGKDIYGRMKQQVEGSQKSLDGLPVRSRESGGAMAGVSREQRAKAILGTHESVASFSEDMFNRHMKAAEGYLKEGMYYRASDSYTMALVYKPGSALAYAGKSHALFGAGEYMSSALFLSRTLEALPEYVRRMESAEGQAGRVSIFKLLAPSFRLLERDKLESRAADVVQWQERSDSGELQFLLSYVYYQMGRAEPAKEAIQKAYEKMPDSRAVSVLKKAIESGGNFDAGLPEAAQPLDRR